MKPLHGIRIADFTVHAAGPFCTHILSQLGAECIKIESAARPDIFRKPHAVYGRLGPATFDQVASNKLSIRLNLKSAEGVALAKRLVGISDVAAESFRAGVMQRLGLGYEELQAVKRDIVMVSISSSGQTGPDSHYAGYAPLFGAWGGLGYLTGYRDGPPVEMRHVMDHSVGLNAALATVAALHKRRLTGEGSHIDVAAREVATSLIAESFLAAAAGHELVRSGNEDAICAPHGVYASAEHDRWVTLAVRTDEEWQRLIAVMGRPELGMDARFRDQVSRHAARAELDAIVGAWLATCDPEAIVETLQQNGIAAHISWTARDIVEDPHLRARRAIVEVPEGDTGAMRAAVGAPARFSRSENPSIKRGTPKLGEDEAYVFGELLGLSTREYQRLVDDRIIH
ncbi:CaiB/BaiF CoA transferase family protein [Daeguia caeni]|uniref:CaiB/BaiF CoA transferase family protein n=1 Tax=Daeguia caeni TaxID=439612 RepID=A0ABV9H9X6_9HYPH